jgi:hypothetical protein
MKKGEFVGESGDISSFSLILNKSLEVSLANKHRDAECLKDTRGWL